MEKQKTKTLDMTQGSLWKHIFLFSMPLVLAQLLEVMFNLSDAAVLYLKIYALGMPAMAVYNFGNGVLSAKGDTKSPLIYLAVAGVLNIILNLIFVIGFHLAAAGVAIASAIAQYVSMLLVMRNLLKRRDVCRLQISKIQFHQDVAKGVLLMGIPTGLQNAIFAHFHTIPSLYLLYPFSWTLTAIAEIAYFIVQFRKVMPKSRI